MSGTPTPPDGPGGGVSVSGGQGIQVGDHDIQTNLGVDARTLPPAQTVSPGRVVHNLPPASAVFVGRDLDELDALLRGEGSGVVGQAAVGQAAVGQAAVGQAAVHGLGGAGKTELAVHYARRHLDRYTLVWWITADSAENVTLGLAALTRRLHPIATLADAREWATGWLQSHTGWLLVLDNVEDFDHVRDLLGQVSGRGQVIVTTRRDLGRARWAALGLAPLRLGALTRAASVDLLTRLTGHHDRVAAARLAADLGDLPLALEQAAAYISQQAVGFDGYRSLLADRFERVAAYPGEGGASQRTIAGVWQVAMAQVATRSALATRVLDVTAWMAPDALPEDVLAGLAGDPAELAEALALLASYHMISRGEGTVTVHRLVQAVTRANTSRANTSRANTSWADTARAGTTPGGGQDPATTAAALLAATAPDDPANNVDGWPRWTQLLPHIDTLTGHLGADHTNTTALELCERAATFRRSQGQVPAAVTQFEQVLADRIRVLGEDHPDTLATRHHLASAYRDAGRVEDAIILLEQVLADRMRVLGEDHPDTLATRNNLASAYQDAGRVAEAITRFEQVLADVVRVLGEDHRDTLATRHNLAFAYRDAGRAEDAVALFERVLADVVRVLGEDHPHTLTTRHNLAFAYHAAGRAEDAITRFEHVLADRMRVLGEDHPDTLASRHGLAYVYGEAGRVDAAITLFEQVLTGRMRVLGGDHPSTMTAGHNLAFVYRNAGRVQDAIALFEHVLADRMRVLGEDHPDTLASRHSLAHAYREAGRVDDAVALDG